MLQYLFINQPKLYHHNKFIFFILKVSLMDYRGHELSPDQHQLLTILLTKHVTAIIIINESISPNHSLLNVQPFLTQM